MRIATYNVEWFANLFDESGAVMDDQQWSGRHNIRRAEQLDGLARVFNAIDADAIMVIEAPDGHARRSGGHALERFAEWAGLRARAAVLGFFSETQQEIALLYDPDVLRAHHDPIGDPTGKKGSREAPRFDGVFRLDLNVDGAPDLVRFSKPPLELEMEAIASGVRFRMIGVHAKSKAPHGARKAADVMRISIDNRRKQLAQCIWLRARVEEHLSAADPLIVLGDFNDGPGLDEYEKLFGRSGIEIVMGSEESEAGAQLAPLIEPHARMVLNQKIGAAPVSARFWIKQEKRWLSALLDYVMLSPDLAQKGATWRIWHPFDDPDCYNDPDLRAALLAASDHFPVTVDLAL
ncbi:MAG: endonuclease/exonuclease/phosphatase family protein [Paracoccaceae bacterium]